MPARHVPPSLPVGCMFNGLAASITTSMVAASLPGWASSTTYSTAWRQQVSSSSVLAGGSYSACMVGTFPTSISASASLTSSSIGPFMGCHSSYTCTISPPRADQDCSSSQSALAKHSPGTTSSTYQCLLSPLQFGYL